MTDKSLDLDLDGVTQTIEGGSRALGLPRRSYLVAYESGTSTMFHLPSQGQLVIGRSAQADICLPYESISRQHVAIRIANGVVEIEDLKSHNGTRVNGVRIEGPHELANDDVINIGVLALVFKTDQQTASPHPILDSQRFQQRLLEEVERAARYSRSLTLLVFHAPALESVKAAATLVPKLRVMDVVGVDPDRGEILVLLPEAPADAAPANASRFVSALIGVAPNLRGGMASCPEDGFDLDSLLSGARAALDEAAPGTCVAASETPTRMEIGGRVVVVAEPAMTRVFSLLRKLATADLPVLIMGETGVGKEIAASAIHHWSRRSAKPLLAINCAAMQETLVESDLFGHERGAFSGAVATKPGKFEAAHGGTVFLDEVGELSQAIQAKLLRVLEAKQLTRVGAVRDIEVDIRIVAATNLNLLDEVAAGRFRRDLYYRLSAATVTIPALRERPRELPLLVRRFLADALRRSGSDRQLAIDPEAMRALCAYDWPGNVRELKNAAEYVASIVTGDTVGLEHLPALVANPDRASEAPAAKLPKLADEIRELERRRIADALEAAHGNQTHAAELIGMPLRTFVAKLKQHAISPTTPARPGRPPRSQ